tara:strand:- start:8188 stop:8943 length:756 start_codon:yes stop_codon:yes gene_type:complete
MFDMYGLTKEFYGYAMEILPMVSRARILDFDALREKLEAIGEHNTRILSQVKKGNVFSETHEIGDRQTHFYIESKTSNYYNAVTLSVYQKRGVEERVPHEFLKTRIGLDQCHRPALSLIIVSKGAKVRKIEIRFNSLSGSKLIIDYENNEITIRYLYRNVTFTEAVPVKAHIPAIQVSSKDYETGDARVTREWSLPLEITDSPEVVGVLDDFGEKSSLTRRMGFVNTYRKGKGNLAPIETKEVWAGMLNGY